MKKTLSLGLLLLLLLTAIPIYAQTMGDTMESCTVKMNRTNYDAECGSITVPENRNNPESREITLPITRLPATNKATGAPIFHLTGGPGMSNMQFNPPASLLANHDIVLVGYRGIDGSVILDCPEYIEAMKNLDDHLLSDTSKAKLGEATRACGQRLIAEGVDLDGYNILEVVADLDAARDMLGYQTINLLSESYGTRLAQIYAQHYPKRVERSVMIGVNTPGDFVWEPEMIDQQLAQFNDFCAADPDCSKRTSNLVETMRQVNQTMPERWLFFRIDPDKVKAITFVMLFNRGTAVSVIDAYLSAAEGDASGLALMSLAFDFMVPNLFTWGEFFSKGLSADYDANRDYNQLDAPGTVMGSPMAELVWANANDWPMNRIPDSYNEVVPSSVETLLISGNIDFSTPAPYATKKPAAQARKWQANHSYRHGSHNRLLDRST